MKFVLYTSRCISPQSNVSDLDIMRSALTKNPEHGITGFLHRNQTHYFQCIEGQDEAVDQLLLNLKADKRHADFCTIMMGEIAYPRFAGWSMGYSQQSTVDKEANEINSADLPSVILDYLLDQVNQQMAALIRSEENVRIARLKRA